MAANPKKAAAVKAAVAKDESLVMLVAREPIRHDGKDVAPGDPFTAGPDAAAALLESGAAETAIDE